MKFLQAPTIEELGIYGKLLDYGVLGLAMVTLGYIAYKYWIKDQDEKKKLLEKIEKLENENK